jgi:hypothetical protein
VLKRTRIFAITLRAGNLVGVREFQSVAPIVAHTMAVTLAGEVRFETYVGGAVHGYIESEITHAVIIQTATGYVTFGPDLFCEYWEK